MQRDRVESRSLRSIGYDAENGVMEIEWSSGRVYQYFDVPQSVHAWIARVPDKTAMVNRLVKDRYRFLEVTERMPGATEDLTRALSESLEQIASRREHSSGS